MTPNDVAACMMQELNKDGTLHQDHAASEIEQRFGQDFSSENEAGNLSISRDVLRAFRKVSGDDVVWERGERLWRKRESFDDPGRLQV